MKRTSSKALLEDAGRVYVLRQELKSLEVEREKLEQRIRVLTRKIAEAEEGFHLKYERVVNLARANGDSGGEDVVTPGKLPHQVFSLMKRDPSRLYTAAELSSDLGVRDVQQVRTALARLVTKRLVRRAGVKGQFTI